MTDYPYGYCGMPCALCSRYRTNGKSRCLGCSHGGYYTDVCKAYRCCREKGVGHCGSCDAFPCARLGKMGDFRDLDTNHVKERTRKTIASEGFEAWYSDYAERADMLALALERYNDGRMKRFLCELFIKQELSTLHEIMTKAENLDGTPKDKGKAFKAITESVVITTES